MRDLIKYFENYKSGVIAFSGGVDSTFLLEAARLCASMRPVAVTVVSPCFPEHELEFTREFCAARGIEHIELSFNPLEIAEFRDNTPERCYACKKALFKALIERFSAPVFEGTNFDDRSDFRPGMRALCELSIKSPLLELGYTKERIRALSRSLSLPTSDKPSYACLATRIPYYESITADKLRRVELAERFMFSLGFTRLRVRSLEDTARIELADSDIEKCAGARREIVSELKRLGFEQVTLSLVEFKSGSMNKKISP